MKLKTITLLTSKEYFKYRDIIPSLNNVWWWTKTPVSGVDGFVDIVVGKRVTTTYADNCGGVRPVCYFELELTDREFWSKPEKFIGCDITYQKHNWTILNFKNEELLVLYNGILKTCCFNDIACDIEWARSSLKVWLETEGRKLIET